METVEYPSGVEIMRVALATRFVKVVTITFIPVDATLAVQPVSGYMYSCNGQWLQWQMR